MTHTPRTVPAFVFALTVTLALLVSACGLRPVYGVASNKAATTISNISISTIPERSGQKLRNKLVDALYLHGVPQNPTYTLMVTPVAETIVGLGIAKDATATRSQLRLSTTITLVDSNKKTQLTRNITAIASFNTLASQYTTLVTEDDARDQAINDLSQQIVTQLELFLSRP